MGQKRQSFHARRGIEEKISFFARDHEFTEKLRQDAQAELRAEIWELADQIGLRGTLLDNYIEDWVQEGYIKAEEQFEKWDPKLGPSSHWVFLKAKDIAYRWIERLRVEHRKLQDLADKGSPLVHKVNQGTNKDPMSGVDLEDFLADLRKQALSLSDSRILDLYRQGATIEEISDNEGLSKETAQRRLNRAQGRARQARDISLSPRGRPRLVTKPPHSSKDEPTTTKARQRRISP